MSALALDAVQREVLRRRLAGRECALHEKHSPRFLAGVRWNLFPEFLQHILWGEVRETESVLLCPNGESAVLLALVDLLIGRGWSTGYSEGERRLALLAFDNWQRAAARG